MRSRQNHKKGLKGNYGRLIDFMSQRSELSCFNLLGLADFWCITSFQFRSLVWQPWMCTDTAAHPYVQYVHHFKLHH